MSAPHDRRAFLHGLVSLPLIGGSITLIGNPTGVAEPASDFLLEQDSTWVEGERLRIAEARHDTRAISDLFGPAYEWQLRGCEAAPEEVRARVATRAAVVLSAVGCDWHGGRT
ncbi:hypothetical protein [Methylobacterium nodulans]|uniref:Uncharacterized protein n=1 Tax=Methylobacterium nodulans (strain LMG 21967 / CNCM I-2342 / ORS 2060) TaxID=460265 RepID=B8ISJ6_METNO|nr:hypothetical protein [Methylobacterium nodulans]ACL58836.1 hypothetical protein Mnod_3942 [Methylobacterium nodulans ORS 2060]